MKFLRLYKTTLRENLPMKQALAKMTLKNGIMRISLREFLKNELDCIVWAVIHEDRPVGWAIGVPHRSEKIVVLSVYVDRQHRKKGLGRELICRVMKSACRKGFLEFRYYPHALNARRFFLSMYSHTSSNKHLFRKYSQFSREEKVKFRSKQALSTFLNQRSRR